MIRSILLASLFLAAQVHAGDLSRPEKEIFLRTARVVSVRDVGEGATHPMKVVLDNGKVPMKAIFKTVDLRMASPTRFGAETVSEYLDSYRYEIAAYELDKLLGLDLLPVIVERKINGRRGSLREWVDPVLPRYGSDRPLPDMDRMQDWAHLLWLFDYLVYNQDRRTNNLMLAPDWTPILIDHSMTFSTFERPFRPLYRFPREVVDRLRALDERTVKKALGRYLRSAQIQAFMRRRRIVLDRVAQQLSERPESDVLFSLRALRPAPLPGESSVRK